MVRLDIPDETPNCRACVRTPAGPARLLDGLPEEATHGLRVESLAVLAREHEPCVAPRVVALLLLVELGAVAPPGGSRQCGSARDLRDNGFSGICCPFPGWSGAFGVPFAAGPAVGSSLPPTREKQGVS